MVAAIVVATMLVLLALLVQADTTPGWKATLVLILVLVIADFVALGLGRKGLLHLLRSTLPRK